MRRTLQNPFGCGAKVIGGAFYARRGIRASMQNALAGCKSVALYAPRRYSHTI